jgi:hypothetical protein
MLHSEAAYLDFYPEQSQAIAFASQTLADLGGAEAKGVALQCSYIRRSTRERCSLKTRCWSVVEHRKILHNRNRLDVCPASF